MQEPRKSTLLFVQDAAAEPAALGAFAAEQPALALVTADGLDEAERKLAQLDPALVVWPGARVPAGTCAERRIFHLSL